MMACLRLRKRGMNCFPAGRSGWLFRIAHCDPIRDPICERAGVVSDSRTRVSPVGLTPDPIHDLSHP
jgi:hypothetical protein